MAMFAKLPCYIINLEQVQLIEFEEYPPLAIVSWSNGVESTILHGADALALIDAVEQAKGLIDVSTYINSEETK